MNCFMCKYSFTTSMKCFTDKFIILRKTKFVLIFPPFITKIPKRHYTVHMITQKELRYKGVKMVLDVDEMERVQLQAS